MTLTEAVAKFSDKATATHGVKAGSRVHAVCCGGYGLAEVAGYPDGEDIPDEDKATYMVLLIFGQEAFGNDLEWAYARALRRLAGETIEPETVTGVLVVPEEVA